MFSKKTFFVFQERELSYISRVVKTNFLIFLVLKDKNSCFFPGEPCRVFQVFPFFTFLMCFYVSPFSDVFIFHLSQVFHFSPFSGVSFFTFLGRFIFHLSWVFPCFAFLGCFHFSPFLGVFIFQPFSGVSFFTFFGVFLYCCTVSATDLRELFLFSDIFYLTPFPDIWHNLLLSRLPWELAVLHWRLQGLPLRFETQSSPICLFKSHSVQQKVFSKFYLCVKALPNTISTSSRFWTCYLIVICIVECMSYPLGHIRSYWLLVYKCI